MSIDQSSTVPRRKTVSEASPAAAPPRIAWRSGTLPLALLGSLLMWAALPPLDLWPLAWAAPVPWLLIVRRETLAGRRPYLALWLAGFVFWLMAIHWLRLPHPATSIGWVALSFYLALYVPAFVALSRVAVHRLKLPLILAAPAGLDGPGVGPRTSAHRLQHGIARSHAAPLDLADPGRRLRRRVCRELQRAVRRRLPGAHVSRATASRWRSGRRSRPLGCWRPCWSTAMPRRPTVRLAPGPKIALIQGSIDTTMKADPAEVVADPQAVHRFDARGAGRPPRCWT